MESPRLELDSVVPVLDARLDLAELLLELELELLALRLLTARLELDVEIELELELAVTALTVIALVPGLKQIL